MNKSVMALTAIVLALGTASCDLDRGEEARPTSESSYEEGLHIRVFVDASGSLRSSTLTTALENLLGALPQVCDHLGASRLTWYHFACDGWTPEMRFSVRFTGGAQSRPKARSKLTLSFKNFAEANAAKELHLATMARSARLEQMSGMIEAERTTIFSSTVEGTGAPCSDLNGLIRHILASSASSRHLNMIVSDGAENCRKEGLLGITDQHEDAAILFILIPEDPSTPGATRIARMSGWEQFQIRKEEIAGAIPGVAIVPYTAPDLQEVCRGLLASK